MKALEEPILNDGEYGYRPQLTKPFQALLQNAVDVITPLVTVVESDTLVYFMLPNGDKLDPHCCDDPKCFRPVRKKLESQNRKDKIITVHCDNSYDHDRIDFCYMCGRLLNSQLTYAANDIEHIESFKDEWNAENFKLEAFTIKAILEAMPTNDHKVTPYDLHQQSLGNDKPLLKKLLNRTAFYQTVEELARAVITTFETPVLQDATPERS